jgi:peptidoglycan hydrolase CwlO-like protein
LIDKITAVRDSTAAKSAFRHRVVAGVFAGLVVTSPLATATVAARADQMPSLQVQANQLAAQISKGASRIAALTAQYTAYNQQAAKTSSDMVTAQAQLAATQRTISANRETLHREAITAYMEDGGARGQALSNASDTSGNLIIRQQYMQLASGNVVDTLDRLRIGLNDLRLAETSLRQAQTASQQAADRVTQARQAALAEAAQEQQTLNSVHGQMAQLVAQAAAAAFARQAAARQVASRSASTQGLPVNGGLLSAVTNVVSAPKPSPPPPSPSPGPPSGGGGGGGGGGAGGVWAALRQCESGGNYAENSGNGYYGAYQFSQQTWTYLGYPGRPDLAPPAMQDAAAQKLQAQSGWGQWPACAAALGLI